MSDPGAAAGVVPTSHLVAHAALRTDVGRVRSENQDHAAMTSDKESRAAVPGGQLLIVADGMGGHRGGATASRLAAETIKSQYLGSESRDVATVLAEALARANARIFSESQSNADLQGMGTTASALVLRDNQTWFAHVGDSRIYLLRGDELRQLTDDHSLVASMMREGLLTPQEAATHPRRNVLQRSMGVSEQVEIDVRGPMAAREGDVFILCSDGLHGVVNEGELREVARLPVDAAADEFIRLALERGAPDNVTVIVARIEPGDVGEDTTIVERDHRLFDDTVVDRQPRAAAPATPTALPATALPATTPPVTTPPVTTNGAVTEPPAPAHVPPEPRRSAAGAVLKWALLFVLVMSAAGAWLFWAQNQGLRSSTTTTSKR